MANDVYYCSNCGGIMVFDIATQSLKCPNCDTTIEIQENAAGIVEHKLTLSAVRKLTVQEKTTETKQCKSCGAIVEIAKDCTATQCAYCGADYVLAEKQVEALVPDGVVPFKVDKQEAGEVFTKWIKKRWLAPGELKRLYESDRIQGVYIPYWTFDADTICTYTAQGGKCRTEKTKDADGNVHEKEVVDWYSTSGTVTKFFNDVQVKASKNMKANLLKGIQPFDTIHQLKSYAPEYLSGYGAECYSVPLEEAHQEARKEMESELKSMAREDVLHRYDRVKDVLVNPRYNDETYKHVMIPVYSTAYTYKDKNYTVLINGQSGKISGDYPKSPLKIALIVAVVLAIILGLYVFTNEAEAAELETETVETATTAEYTIYDEIN